MASEADATKADLLRYSYEQVLDATKHQDDKVGRLLTTIAFLTAASLALAGLGGAKAIGVPVELGGKTPGSSYLLAVALVCLVAYLIGVSITVIQLIGSLSTPLRLPGLDPARRNSSSEKKDARYKKDAVPSTIYFHEIEKNTPEEWKEVWSADTRLIQVRRTQSLIGETHNLAIRTSFKYNRTNEATAVLTWALMALSLTVCFMAIIILDETHPLGVKDGDPVLPVILDWQDTLLLGSVLTAITFAWSVARMRHSRLGRDHESGKPMARLQGAVVVGSAVSILWAISSPLLIPKDWQLIFFSGGIGFTSMFTANCMAWATLGQAQTFRVNAGLRPFQLWQQAVPWALGSFGGSLVALACACAVGKVPIRPKRDTTALPDHEGPWVRCRSCKERGHEATATTIKWRIGAILSFSGLFSLAAQQFTVDQAYGWPLVATGAALTALVGVAVLEPTFLDRRERDIKAQRRKHEEALTAEKERAKKPAAADALAAAQARGTP